MSQHDDPTPIGAIRRRIESHRDGLVTDQGHRLADAPARAARPLTASCKLKDDVLRLGAMVEDAWNEPAGR